MAQTENDEQIKGVAISDVAIKQPVFITMMMLIAVVLGLIAYQALPVDQFPDFSSPNVSITIRYPGAGPETVAEQVTERVEEAVNTVSGVTGITSTSTDGLAQINVELDQSVDDSDALQLIREEVETVLPQLPTDAEDPIYQQFSSDSIPVLQLVVAGNDSLSLLELRTLVDEEFAPTLQRIDGVGSVDVSGGQERQINVLLDLDRLQVYQLSPSQITNSIRSANTNLGLGNIDTGEQDISLRAPGQLSSIEDIANIAITGTSYRIRDIATVEDSVAEEDGYARLNGNNAVAINIVKQSGANSVEVANTAREQFDELITEYPNLSYVITNDQSVEIEASVESSIEEMVIAVICAFLVVWLFFRDFRNTLVTMAGLPVILIATFAGLWIFSIGVNTISLLGLSLVVGLVIDDAIVVRENIFRYLQHGYSPMQAASRGTAQVALSVVAMTLTIIAVFLPVTFASGITGVIFATFGLTVVAAMTLSIVEAFTLAPMLSANLFKKNPKQGQQKAITGEESHKQSDEPDEADEDAGPLGQWYGRLLRWSLRHRFAQIGIVVIILLISVFVATGLQVAFLPPQDSDTFTVGFETPPGTSLVQTDMLAQRAEEVFLSNPAIASVQSDVGGTGSPEQAEFTIRINEGEDADIVRAVLRQELDFLPNIIFSAQSFQGGGTGVTGRNVQATIQTNGSLADLVPVAEQIEQTAQGINGLVDIGSTYQPGRSEVQFFIDPVKAGDLGITNNDIASAVRVLFNGDTATSLRQGGQDIDVVVELPPDQRAETNDINAINIATPTGNVPLSSVAQVEVASAPTNIRRSNLQNEIIVGANAAEGLNSTELQAQLSAAVAQLDLPNGVFVSYGGEQQDLLEGFETLFIAMAFSVLCVYIVLASQFGSFLQPLVIMLAMPFSFLGAFVALSISGLPLDITGLIGLILLMGLVVKNSILLIDFTNKLRASGLDKHTALERAGAIRLRPILMTALSVIGAAIPVAFGIHFFSSGEGSEFRRGLGVVVMGGMISSTLLTLLVVPAAYSLLDSSIQGVRKLFKREPQPEFAVATTAAVSEGIAHHTANDLPVNNQMNTAIANETNVHDADGVSNISRPASSEPQN
ncbi:MAG: hypothetical protein GFH27_549361n29 [Chloroflexi bacterium AL-W]|nr:hypothetical protein [Chloroflexi bacterium AL-N1]NOK70741.1 hypothetical protein [Chloroflexi bacterium AL-N10]NOK78301.1 hypothetical protein [Chloroflexi bacterium AL-N5]NOK85644.1 hypothetical protein [Chloroflexi bacterium AL-W]NOK92558.1 hypothetical protein [Chloroflexi bacterium AL-N15]